MRTSLLLSLLFLYGSTVLSQNNETVERADSILLRNCAKTITTFESIYNDDKIGSSALFYPESTMQTLKGCQITTLYLGIIDVKNTESVSVFISHQLKEPYDYAQTVVPTKNNWNRITLTTPYHIDGKPLYIGYTMKGRLLCYSKVDDKGEEWINQRNNQWKKFPDAYSASLYAVVEGKEKLPAHNIRLKNIQMPSYALTNNPIPFSGSIRNMGTETIHSLEFMYQVGETLHKETIEDLDISSQTETTFLINGLKIEKEGEPNLTLSVTAVNGQPDLDQTDNVSRTVPFICRNKFTPRKTLVEVFSTEQCPNCPEGHRTLGKVLQESDRVIELVHHSGFYQDQFTIPASKAYEWFYAPNNLHAPAMMLDRKNGCDNYPDAYNVDTPVIPINEQTVSLIANEAINAPAFATVNLSIEKKNEAQRSIRIQIDGKGILPIPSNERDHLFVFLTEDSIYSLRQSGASAGFYQRHVARMCITNTWGDVIQLSEGYQANYEVTIPSTWNTEQMSVVAFVGNYDEVNRNNCHIYNAESKSLKTILPSSTHSPMTEELSIVQAGYNLLITGRYTTIKLYSIDGRCLLSNSESKQCVSLESFPKGSYMVHINNGKRQQSLKINL